MVRTWVLVLFQLKIYFSSRAKRLIKCSKPIKKVILRCLKFGEAGYINLCSKEKKTKKNFTENFISKPWPAKQVARDGPIPEPKLVHLTKENWYSTFSSWKNFNLSKQLQKFQSYFSLQKFPREVLKLKKA